MFVIDKNDMVDKMGNPDKPYLREMTDQIEIRTRDYLGSITGY